MNTTTIIGRLAKEEGLHPPTDWQKGEILVWKGRRTYISQDLQSKQCTNFAGHVTLVTIDGQFVSFMPDLEREGTSFCYHRFEGWVKGKERDKLQTWNEVGKLVTDDFDSVCYALKAGIEVMKYPVLYSPKRLQYLLAARPDLLQSCRYAWNIDVEKRLLNCNTFFQVWDITKDLPWAHKLSEFHHEVGKVSRGSQLRNFL